MSIQLQELEITEPLGNIILEADNYQACWLLIRFRGEPLGWLKYKANQLPRLAAQVRDDIARQYGNKLLVVAFRQQLATPDALSDFNLTQFFSPTPPHQLTPLKIPFSVIISPAKQNGELEACLTGLAKQNYPAFELLLLADQPDSQTDKLAAKYRAAVIPIAEAGLAETLAQAAARAQYDLLAFTSTAGVVDTNWLASLAEAFNSANVVAACGPHLPLQLSTAGQIVSFSHLPHPTDFERRFFQGQPFDYAPANFGTWLNGAFRRDFWLDQLAKNNLTSPLVLPFFYWALEQGKTVVYEPRALVRERFERDAHKALEQIRLELAAQSQFVKSASGLSAQPTKILQQLAIATKLIKRQQQMLHYNRITGKSFLQLFR